MVQPFFVLTMRKLETFRVRIESLAFEGKGIAHINGKVVFVRNAIPGDFVEIILIKNKKDYAEGEVIEVLEPSPNRITPKCKHFGICGGCSFQNLPYTEQINWKHKLVQEALQKIGKLTNIEINPPLPSPLDFSYRNKVEFSFGAKYWLEESEKFEQPTIAVGFHKPERFEKIVDIQNCFLFNNYGSEVLNIIRKEAEEFDLPAYNLRSHLGFLRNLVVRYSFYSNELLINLVTTSQIGEREKEFLDWYSNEFPKLDFVQHILHTINDSFSPTTYGAFKVIKGSGFLFEKLGDLLFRISPFSFFQVNSLQAEVLVNKVMEFAKPSGKVIWDLYSGAGTFTFALAQKSRFVFVIESNVEAVNDAKVNAELNNISNVIFYVKDLHSKGITKDLKGLENPDVVVVDPPRTGLHKNLLKALLEILPHKIVYVSCNPTTLARDLQELGKFYNVEEVQPVDMFPQTYHIETIVDLELI